VRANAVKSFITGIDYRGRNDAYGRPEDMRPIDKTFVIWHTRNSPQFLEDPTGNRRFLPMPLYDYVDEDWLIINKDQLWAEIVELEERGGREYVENNPYVKRGEEKFADIFLPKGPYDESDELGAKHMKEGVTLSIIII
jgi:putative DNA primase/helicase